MLYTNARRTKTQRIFHPTLPVRVLASIRIVLKSLKFFLFISFRFSGEENISRERPSHMLEEVII